MYLKRDFSTLSIMIEHHGGFIGRGQDGKSQTRQVLLTEHDIALRLVQWLKNIVVLEHLNVIYLLGSVMKEQVRHVSQERFWYTQYHD